MTKVNGKGEIVTSRFKGYHEGQHPNLKKTKVVLLLSIRDKKYCEGLFFEAALKKALLAHGKIIILIADIIYWHNLIKNVNPSIDDIESSKKEALKLGNEFFKKQLPYFLALPQMTEESFNQEYPNLSVDEQIACINRLAQKHSLNFEIVRWNDWVNQLPSDVSSSQTVEISHEATFLNEINTVLTSSETFKQGVVTQAEHYIQRHKGESIDEALVQARSRGYVEEESRFLMPLAILLGIEFIAYPDPIPEAFQAVKNELAKNPSSCGISGEELSKRANWLEITFNLTNSPTLKPVSPTSYSPGRSPFSGAPSLFCTRSERRNSKNNNLDTAVVSPTIVFELAFGSIVNSPLIPDEKIALLCGLAREFNKMLSGSTSSSTVVIEETIVPSTYSI